MSDKSLYSWRQSFETNLERESDRLSAENLSTTQGQYCLITTEFDRREGRIHIFVRTDTETHTAIP